MRVLIKISRQITTFTNSLNFDEFSLGIWSLISGIMATFCLHIHYININEQLEMFYTKDRLKFTGLLGLFMTIISLLGKFT